MSEIALYRKYRPESWKDVLGQEHIVKVLQGAIKLGNISHSYLFIGSRGTGKTTVARIIAHELGTSDNDIFEIDAASNRGIDNMRELRENIATSPFDSKYKIYIIDEAHMLTKEAWNAFLKTLEEPPAHVIFILATTEIDKVPETIISRCQVFTFRKPTLSVLKEMILGVAKKEDFKITPTGAELLSVLGDGSFRDTHGILQKVMSFSKDKKIDINEIESVTNAPSSVLLTGILKSIVEKDIASALTWVKKAIEQNIDMEIFLKLLTIRLRTLLLIRYAPEIKKELMESMPIEEQDAFMELLKSKGSSLSSKTLEILLDANEKIRYASVPSLPLELALINIIGE